MPNYVIDTNIISQLIKNPSASVKDRLKTVLDTGGVLFTSEAVRYEIERGLRKKEATKQLEIFHRRVVPVFSIVAVDWPTWDAAADLWVYATNNGRQLADVDLLVVALAIRLDAILVSADRDYSAFPSVKTENWMEENN